MKEEYTLERLNRDRKSLGLENNIYLYFETVNTEETRTIRVGTY